VEFRVLVRIQDFLTQPCSIARVQNRSDSDWIPSSS
jgi:hypothetical protein